MVSPPYMYCRDDFDRTTFRNLPTNGDQGSFPNKSSVRRYSRQKKGHPKVA